MPLSEIENCAEQKLLRVSDAFREEKAQEQQEIASNKETVKSFYELAGIWGAAAVVFLIGGYTGKRRAKKEGEQPKPNGVEGPSQG